MHIKAQIPLGPSPSRHDTHVVRVGIISQNAHCQLLPFSSVIFRFYLDYFHSEPSR